jgi:hypothetical protein
MFFNLAVIELNICYYFHANNTEKRGLKALINLKEWETMLNDGREFLRDLSG